MVTIKTLLFFIILIILVTKFNSFYRNIYDDVFAVSEQYIKSFIKNNSIMLYLYVIVLFYLASKASLFELTNGYYVSHIKQMLSSINNQNDKYSQPKPYINELSIISVIIFSLVTSISGSGLGSEGVMIYLSIILINYLYFTCKKLFNLDNINTELLIYSGFAIGFDATFTSLISTIIFIFEKMFIYHSAILYSYHLIVLLLIILFIHSLLKSRIPILNIGDIHFNYYSISNLLYIVILSIIIGVICFMFFTSFMFLYNAVKRNKYKDFMVVMFGIILAFMIQHFGLFISGSGENVINYGFNAVINNNNSEKFNYKNVFGKLINCIISLGSGLPGGIIIPSMTIGTGLGSVYYNIVKNDYFKSMQNIIPMTMPIENIMYIGMVSFLSPMLGAPITSAVVINQISKQSFNTIPISLISSFISYYTYKILYNSQ